MTNLWSGGREESHLPAPTDPYVSLSGLFRVRNNSDYAERVAAAPASLSPVSIV
jgi:hypothetical protein